MTGNSPSSQQAKPRRRLSAVEVQALKDLTKDILTELRLIRNSEAETVPELQRSLKIPADMIRRDLTVLTALDFLQSPSTEEQLDELYDWITRP